MSEMTWWYIKGFWPQWCIFTVIYSRDIPFWLETLDIQSHSSWIYAWYGVLWNRFNPHALEYTAADYWLAVWMVWIDCWAVKFWQCYNHCYLHCICWQKPSGMPIFRYFPFFLLFLARSVMLIFFIFSYFIFLFLNFLSLFVFIFCET